MKLWMSSAVLTYGCNDSTLDEERAYMLMLTLLGLSWRYLRRDEPVEPAMILTSVLISYSKKKR